MKRVLLIFTILIACVGCDQTTKSVAKSSLSEAEAISLVGGSIRLQIAKNYGAFLSMGESLPARWRIGLFSTGVAVVLAGLLAYALISKRINPVTVAASAMIVGGGLSNLIDRFVYGGYAVDFINVGVGPVRTGIFNLADACIMVGMALWLFGDRIWRWMGSGHEEHAG